MKVYTLNNKNGVEVKVTDFGGIILSLKVPDRNGRYADVVLGFDTPEEYPAGPPFFGALIGRYANRIAGGFTIDGVHHPLPLNDGPNQLHGGDEGFHATIWRVEPYEDNEGEGLNLRHTSPDGHMGYPGELTVEADYKLTQENALVISFRAATTKPTPVSFSHHNYYNLTGDFTKSIEGHLLQINAAQFTPINRSGAPTGDIAPVKGGPFDFQEAKPIGRDINHHDDQLACSGGYDHNFVLTKTTGEFATAAVLCDPESGRMMELKTTAPGLQFYSGNGLDGSLTGKGVPYGARSGLCLEPQHFPDAPNQPHFPNTILRPGDVYRSRMAMIFSTLP